MVTFFKACNWHNQEWFLYVLGDIHSSQIIHVFIHQCKEAKLEGYCDGINNSAFVLCIGYVTTIILTHSHSECQSTQWIGVSKKQHAPMYYYLGGGARLSYKFH